MNSFYGAVIQTVPAVEHGTQFKSVLGLVYVHFNKLVEILLLQQLKHSHHVLICPSLARSALDIGKRRLVLVHVLLHKCADLVNDVFEASLEHALWNQRLYHRSETTEHTFRDRQVYSRVEKGFEVYAVKDPSTSVNEEVSAVSVTQLHEQRQCGPNCDGVRSQHKLVKCDYRRREMVCLDRRAQALRTGFVIVELSAQRQSRMSYECSGLMYSLR